MCGGATYTVNRNKVTVYFPNPKAQLPVLLKDGTIELYDWGRRESQAGRLPLGGWARLESIKSGKWEYTNPTPCKIIVDSFMEKDNTKKSHWFDLDPNCFIQGLYARLGEEQKLYVVTVEPEGELMKIHNRFPRIIKY
ncbi:MAG: hypothetical protein HQL46_00905 [Gammaproteobacteria bacterium]|nr:hypothetical protein [Gammaproteobacteria bacterium]